MKIKLMSFNTQHCLNYLEQKVDYEAMARQINEVGADIVGLNEMYDAGSLYGEQTRRLSELTTLKSFYFATAINLSEGTYGNGMLSRCKILSAETIKIPDPEPRGYDGYYETRCVLKARLENGLTVLVVHFGLNPDEHKSAVETILKSLEEKKCILMGDFNIAPDNELLKPIREKMIDTAIGWCDGKKSWPSDEPTIKIDYIFVTPDIEVISADIPPLMASDHRPHIAEINIK